MTVSSTLPTHAAALTVQTLRPAVADLDRWYRFRRALEALLVPIIALGVAAAIISFLLLLLGKSPAAFFELVWRGAFGSWFSLQNTLQRAAPLLLTALCVALPARVGLIIIGGEGAL